MQLQRSGFHKIELKELLQTDNQRYSEMKEIDALNDKYAPLAPLDRVKELYNDFNDVLVTSSFGTSSAILLKMINSVNPDQLVHFIDTTFVFRETEEYKNQLSTQLNLQVKNVKPDPYLNQYTRARKTWETDTDTCCAVNKLSPIEAIKADYEVWISGLMGWQNAERKDKKVFEFKNDILKFHPIIDVSEEEASMFMLVNELPEHPLRKLGFASVGCTHCTKKGSQRDGRWAGKVKTECGLHI